MALPEVPLPNAQRAVVDADKVRDYLLSTSHPIGRFKSVFFKALGYSQDAWPALQHDLLALAQGGAAIAGTPSAYGMKYEVGGTLIGPNGRAANVKTIWLVRHGDSVPRLVTAFPG